MVHTGLSSRTHRLTQTHYDVAPSQHALSLEAPSRLNYVLCVSIRDLRDGTDDPSARAEREMTEKGK